jgi:predicted nucleic acid-binding protein
LPKEALFLAGKVFRQYKRNQGTKLSSLPDFFIGAHAAVLNVGLITRDVARYRTYFPTVTLITP